MTRALQSTPFQNPGGGTVSITAEEEDKRTEILVSNIGYSLLGLILYLEWPIHLVVRGNIYCILNDTVSCSGILFIVRANAFLVYVNLFMLKAINSLLGPIYFFM